MDRDKELELLSECVKLTGEGRPHMTDDETLVPVAKYLDPATFERELDLVFRPSMNLAAHGSQLAAPGDFITRNLLGAPVILVRGKDGRARAFLNVCRHRGATVELRERGTCRRFVCPYHAWTYETDGSLAAVRHQEGFPSLDIERNGLVELDCREAAGFLWVCPVPGISVDFPDQGTDTLLSELEGLGCGEGAVFESESRVWKANWKLIVDGGLESYHFKIAHRNTVGGFFADNISTFRFLGDHIRTVLPRATVPALAERPESEWSIRKDSHLVYAIYPNATVLMQEGHFELILMTPLSVDETRVEIATVAPHPGPEGYGEKARAFWAANHAFTKATLHEDFELAEQIQRGMATGANRVFRFGRFEGALSRWHEMLDAKLGR